MQPVGSGRNITGIRSKIISVHGLMFAVSEVKGIPSVMENRFKQHCLTVGAGVVKNAENESVFRWLSNYRVPVNLT